MISEDIFFPLSFKLCHAWSVLAIDFLIIILFVTDAAVLVLERQASCPLTSCRIYFLPASHSVYPTTCSFFFAHSTSSQPYICPAILFPYWCLAYPTTCTCIFLPNQPSAQQLLFRTTLLPILLPYHLPTQPSRGETHLNSGLRVVAGNSAMGGERGVPKEWLRRPPVAVGSGWQWSRRRPEVRRPRVILKHAHPVSL